MGWLSGFDNSSHSSSVSRSNTTTVTNASYGAGSQVNLSLSGIELSDSSRRTVGIGSASGGGLFNFNPEINVLDNGAIAAAFDFARQANETSSATTARIAEVARLAGQPANALIEKIGTNLVVMVALVAGVALIATKGLK